MTSLAANIRTVIVLHEPERITVISFANSLCSLLPFVRFPLKVTVNDITQ